MILVVDVGNTNVCIGMYDKEKLIFLARLSTDSRRTAEQYAVEISQTMALEKKDLSLVTGALVSSVVPELTGEIKRAIFILTGIVPMILGPGIKSGLNIKIDNPAQLGSDLVAGAVAAIGKFELPCLVMDLGTATKISVIDKNACYRGCTISAGVGISLKALAGSTALLQTVDLDVQNCHAFGTNTISSMQAGIILGTASMLDGLCDRIEEALGEKVKTVVATGGLSSGISKHCKRQPLYEPNLILEGLRMIYERNCRT